ncbi:MAG: radical SAM protein [Chloroflexota bacterium]|nr:radical SAM protein [Chloroflexota bacterium]
MGRILEIDGLVFTDKHLVPIWEKVRAGTRLSDEEGLYMYSSPDFAAVGQMANWAKTRNTANYVFYVINRQINPTNICTFSCKFCDFSKKRGDPEAYEMSIEEILASIDKEVREIHIVGGHHPDWPFEYYVEMVQSVHNNFPSAHIKAFTASEIDFFDRRWKVSPQEALSRLKSAGLDSMPGGGAEIFSSRIQKQLFPGKAGASRWLDIHRIAHKMEIRSNCTMLYGHIETYEERIPSRPSPPGESRGSEASTAPHTAFTSPSPPTTSPGCRS